MTSLLLAIFCGLLSLALGFSLYYLVKFAKIIMVFEDDLSDAMSSLNNAEDGLRNLLEMPMFYDSPEVKEQVEKALEEVRYRRGEINGIAQRFTDRSKRKYVTVWDESPSAPITQQRKEAPRFPGQPPNTPNPVEMIRSEGIDVNGWEGQ